MGKQIKNVFMYVTIYTRLVVVNRTWSLTKEHKKYIYKTIMLYINCILLLWTKSMLIKNKNMEANKNNIIITLQRSEITL